MPIFHGGRQVGTRRVYNEQLAMFHLKQAAPAAAGSAESVDLRIGRLSREEAIAGLLHDNPGMYRDQAERIVADPSA